MLINDNVITNRPLKQNIKIKNTLGKEIEELILETEMIFYELYSPENILEEL